VGGFIIYNAMTFAVLRRRPLLGTLRTLGVTRGQLFALVLGEALVFALVGASIGVAAGVGVGWGLVQLVIRTIDDLYFALTVSGLFVSPGSLLMGAGLGVLTTLVAALGPALEAAASQPRDVLRRHRIEQHGGRLVPWLALAGVGLMLAGLAIVPVSGRSIALGFVALFAVVVGFGLCVPLALKGLALALGPLLGRLVGTQGRLAARGLVAAISRTGLAAAALTVAVSATVGVGIMIDSFRGSVSAWLESTLASDLYVSAPSASSGLGDGTLPRGLAKAVAAVPGVAEVSQGRSVRVQARAGPVALLALEGSSRSRRGFRFLGETADDLWPRFQDGRLVLISEPYAYRQGLATGDRVALFTSQGWQDFEVGGVFQDYGSDSGMLVLARRTYARLWEDPEVTTLGLVAAERVDRQAVLERLRTLIAGFPEAVDVRDNRSIREGSLEVFDRTFAITRVLRLLAVGVAFVGVLSALLALQLERGREHAILRATGMTPGQLGGLILLQTGSLGLAAGLLALPLGWIMGDLLIHVVNVRSFGWTLDRIVPAEALALGPLLALTAALLAGLYPARRAARTDPAAALREE
jgi:putative ABC transport system permease protein